MPAILPEQEIRSDGIQVAELVGNTLVLIFNAREVDNGHFHPALLERIANGTGRIQNSKNVASQIPLVEVGFGEEYITDLVLGPGNAMLITEKPAPKVGDGGSASALAGIGAHILLGVYARIRRCRLKAKACCTYQFRQ